MGCSTRRDTSFDAFFDLFSTGLTATACPGGARQYYRYEIPRSSGPGLSPVYGFRGYSSITVNQFELSALTQRSSSLDSAKLEYLNKHHLMQTWSTPEGLHSLAERAHDGIKTAFPTRYAVGCLWHSR